MTYGCHNREPFRETVMVQDGWTQSKPEASSRLPRMVATPFRMSQLCEYRHTDLGKADARCVGCKWREE